MQRSDKIPKLIKILKSFVKYEWKMFDNIWEPKTSYLDASSLHEKADADNQISQALKSVFFLYGAYPELSSNQNCPNLQGRISGLENEILDRIELYNDSVNNYNLRIQSIPNTFVGKTLGLES